MIKIRYHKSFKKDYKLIVKRGYDIAKLEAVVTKLAKQEELEPKYKDHMLIGNYAGFRECHIAPDWLLIYSVNNTELVLCLTRTGSHSDLFD